MIGGAVIVPLQDLGAGCRALVLHPQYQAAVVVLDLVVAAAGGDELPQVVGTAVVGPDQRVGPVRDALVADAEQQPARAVLDLVEVGTLGDEGPLLRAATARGGLHGQC